MQTKVFLSALDHERIVAAIRQAEAGSRGEVRVHVSNRQVDDPQAAAAAVFETLGMTKTADRNGVLVYVAPRSQRFAVIGDEGIHQRLGPAFWSQMAAAMQEDFRAGRFTEAIVQGVGRAGEALARHFPRAEGAHDVNELPDEVSED
jgi:uncharacterized membrane protein